MNFPEKQMMDCVQRYFEARGYRVKREFRVGGRRPDAVCLKGTEVVIIEGKISHVSKVINQLQNWDMFCDYVYCAWGGRFVSPRLEKWCSKQGVGILHCPPPYEDVSTTHYPRCCYDKFKQRHKADIIARFA